MTIHREYFEDGKRMYLLPADACDRWVKLHTDCIPLHRAIKEAQPKPKPKNIEWKQGRKVRQKNSNRSWTFVSEGGAQKIVSPDSFVYGYDPDEWPDDGWEIVT